MNVFDEQKFIPQLSIDCVIFGFHGKELKVLISTIDLIGGIHALPGGFVQQTESIDAAAYRTLRERTGLSNLYLEQFRTFGGANRANNEIIDHLSESTNASVLKSKFSPSALNWLRQRFVSVGYYALVDINKVVPQKADIDTSIDWFPVKELPKMIMDHNEILWLALEALRQNLDKKLIAFNLLPETFTMKEVQSLYEAVYDQPFRRNNFQKKILDLGILERLGKSYTGAANKAPYLYRFKQNQPE